ncbi:hypothetical protein C8A00DRAFT_18969, partial [Chaetomidium leptoderma]
CIQELFSLFILAVTAEVASVGGKTSILLPHGETGRRWNHTLLTSLAWQAVRANVAANLEDALALVIPAFAHYNLSPNVGPRESERSCWIEN